MAFEAPIMALNTTKEPPCKATHKSFTTSRHS